MEMLPVLALLAGCGWLLWQRYGPGMADWHALRTVQIKMRRMAEIAPAELHPAYTHIAGRVEFIIAFMPAQQRQPVRRDLEDIYQDLFSVLLADTTPDPITDYTRNRLAGIDRRVRAVEVLVRLDDD